ncbi:hypothetical protein [Streptomyces glaucescens]|uniref:Putative secreted protein n=1 Tax=Streptomyces glaucescens TaxID=1907 RepID=A0A089XDT4_STRGA|nr:hypothetical protein [Streptomyces glaucescens]AIS00087.1 putative secreted protein [Streptomyces glaucescens]
MTWSAALPGAAARVLRAAGRRRAVQLALLVGGLFLLGALGGARAEAAEGPAGTVSAAAAQATQATQGASTSDVRSSGAEPGPVVEYGSVPRPEPVAEAVRDQVAQPVGDALEAVTRGLSEVPPAESPRPSLPALPSPPSWPALPSSPSLPGLPDDGPSLPDLPGLPANTLPAPDAVTPLPLPLPGPEAHTPGTPDGSARDEAAQTDPRAVSGSAATAGTTAPNGPHTPDGSSPLTLPTATATAVAPTPDHPATARTGTGQAPAHPAPTGGDSGVLGSRTAADNGGSRHGDMCAVAAEQRAPLRPVPGVPARADAGETRDRYRDIPVFPG